jgi:hypothetical protein
VIPVGTIVVLLRRGSLGVVHEVRDHWRYRGEQKIHHVHRFGDDGLLVPCSRCGGTRCDFSCPIASENRWEEELRVLGAEELDQLRRYGCLPIAREE